MRRRAGFARGARRIVEQLADGDPEELGDLLHQLQAGISGCAFVIGDKAPIHAEGFAELRLRKTFGGAKRGHALTELGRGFFGGTTSRHGRSIA